MSRPIADRWAPAGLVLLALALRLYGIDAGLPQVYEEAYPFKTAWTMWGWGPGLGLDLNPHWFRYPGLTIDLQFLGQGLLYLLLTATGAVHSTLDFRVLQQLDPTPFYLMGRSLTALLGALTVLPVFHLARRVAGRGAAIAAALLVAVSPPLIARSQVIEVDVPLTLFVAWGLLAALDLAGGLTRRRAITAGVVVGLAATAKYPGIVLIVPCLVAIALGARAAAAAGRPGRSTPRRDALIAWPAAIGVAGLALLATVFVTSPFLFLDYRSALADLAVEREHMRLGHFGSDLGSTWLTYARDWFTAVAGWPVALTSLAGLVLFLVMRRRAWALVAGSFLLAYAVLVSSFAMKADRYLLPLLPAAFLFACALAAELCDRVAPSTPREGNRRAGAPAASAPGRGVRGRAGLALAAATALLALPALAGLPAHLASLRPDTRTLARAWFEANVPPGAFVASEQYGPPLLSPLELQAIDRDLLGALQQRGYQPKVYAVVSVPLFQVNPDRSAAFYDPALYRVADVFIVTGAVRDRYRREPARFAAQLALYDTLESSWERWREFPSNGGPGPEIVVYRNPAQTTPFAQRRPLPGPPPTLRTGAPTGGEAYFYYNVGLNYELFGFVAPALPAYLEGLSYAAADPASATACAERAAGALARVGRAADAAALLERAAARAPRSADAARLRALRERLPAGGQ
ncbi:MAG: glycosyltransferase family 39 protein [Candidatus Eisenbacteria bacterium]